MKDVASNESMYRLSKIFENLELVGRDSEFIVNCGAQPVGPVSKEVWQIEWK